MSNAPDRKKITFAQAEGIEPLPTQLALRHLDKHARARLWAYLHKVLEDSSYRGRLLDPWLPIIRAHYVLADAGLVDEFDAAFRVQSERLKKRIIEGSYVDVLGFFEWVMRFRGCPPNFPEAVNQILAGARAAYRVVDRDTIVAVATDEEAQAIQQSIESLSDAGLAAARTHLKTAAACLGGGKYADCVREAIHSVESVAKSLEPSADLSKALFKLEASANLHGALKKALLALYGYSSDEQGIRHPLLDGGDANVDEADAMFMLGACASFNTYLIAKAKDQGLL